jgi:hypothetical protein
MSHEAICVHCGEYCTLISPIVFSGWYRCPHCYEAAVYVPESAETPRQSDEWFVEDYDFAN